MLTIYTITHFLFIALSAEVSQQLAMRHELPALPIASDSTADIYSSNFVMDPSNAELMQRHFHEQRGPVGKKSYDFRNQPWLDTWYKLNSTLHTKPSKIKKPPVRCFKVVFFFGVYCLLFLSSGADFVQYDRL